MIFASPRWLIARFTLPTQPVLTVCAFGGILAGSDQPYLLEIGQAPRFRRRLLDARGV